MAVTRPLKEGSVTTYQQKVALGFPDILASEMDADLDTIYAAWNGNVGTANLVDGSVTYAKLAPDAQLWRDTGTTLVPGTSFATRVVAVPGDTNSGTVLLGNATAKGRVQGLTTTPGTIGLLANRNWVGNAQDDATKTSWAALLSAGADNFQVQRSPAGSTTQTNLLTLDNAGALTVTGGVTVGATGSAVRVQMTPRAGLYAEGNILDALYNDPTSLFYNIANPGWSMRLQGTGADLAGFMRRAANQASFAFYLSIDGSGNLVIAGPNATKSAGTSWINPSDRRIKTNITDYEAGLEQILALRPIRYEHNGLGGTTAGQVGYGFVADEVAPVMPEMLGTQRAKLNAEDEDAVELQTLDTTTLPLALVGAVQALAARVAALEAPR